MSNMAMRKLLLLVAVIVASYGQDIYQDSFESSVEESFDVIEDGISPGVVPASSLWHSSENTHLSPPFIDKTLMGNCTGSSAIACTGCRRARVCIPGISDQSILPEVNCPPSSYCHTLAFDMGGACLATIDPQFPECRGTADINGDGGGTGSWHTANNLCTGLGVFPDPSDCRRFNLCSTVGGFARQYKCPSSYVYNSQKKSCSRNTRCRKIQCRPNVGSHFVAYPKDPKYYAYCNYGRSGNQRILKNIVMYRCSAGAVFNELANGCVFKCQREGFFSRPRYPSRFYWCRKVRGKLFGYEQVCPLSNSTFNSRLRICIPPPLSSTTMSTTPMTPMTTAIATPTATSSVATPLITDVPSTTLADEALELPAWPQWDSLPVSSLL